MIKAAPTQSMKNQKYEYDPDDPLFEKKERVFLKWEN